MAELVSKDSQRWQYGSARAIEKSFTCWIDTGVLISGTCVSRYVFNVATSIGCRTDPAIACVVTRTRTLPYAATKETLPDGRVEQQMQDEHNIYCS